MRFEATRAGCALALGLMLAACGGRVVPPSATPAPPARSPATTSYPLPTRKQFETYAQDRLENWIPGPEAEGVKLELHFRHGAPHVEIIDYAEDSQIDLIVMGTHGRGIAAHLLLGSVAEKVIRKAPCPALTVHITGRQFVHA